MNFLNTYEELQNLPLYTRVYEVKNGNVYTYNMLGTFHKVNNVLLSVNNSLEKTRCIHKHQFETRTWTLEHHDIPIGREMIEQILRKAASEVESIFEVYIKGDLKLNKQLYVQDFEKYLDEEIKEHSK